VRDVDYSALAWFPEDSGLDAWLDLYQRVHRRNGSEPDAGRRLLSWAHAAGLRDVVATTSSWCFASPADREWWGTSWAGRATGSSFAEQAVEYGLATPEELTEIDCHATYAVARTAPGSAGGATVVFRYTELTDTWRVLGGGTTTPCRDVPETVRAQLELCR
jgi:hypothetical protein